MASQVLSQQATSDTLYASGGVVTGGDINAATGSLQALQATFQRVNIYDNGSIGFDANLWFQNSPAPPATPSTYVIGNPSGVGGGYIYLRSTNVELFNSQVSASGTNNGLAILGLTSPSQSGTALLAATTSAVVVNNLLVTANTIVMVTVQGAAPDAAATSFSVSNQVGASFTIHSNAPATGNTTLQWFIVHY